MPVNRQMRDKMAQAIAAYMRMEIKTRELEKVTRETTEDKDAETAGVQVWYRYDDFIDHPISVTREGWEYLMRWLAFLKTDYRLKGRKPTRWRHPRVLPLLFLAGLLLSVVISITFGKWAILAITWLILGIAWYPIRRLKFKRDEALVENDDELQELAKVAPFLSARDWREHEGLLKPYQLPEYDPSIHGQPFRKDRHLFSETAFAGLIFCILTLPFLLLWALISATSMMDDDALYIRIHNEKT